ncbi:MAG: helix-turn-helix domain-containing protein [Chloroflexota bacterium]|nr:helix-turn-helix domain-containing protein [Chloroflexota bacterium]
MSGLGIGERLIEAREQRGLSLEDAERDTRISRRYLQALEDERFDIIPAPVYARGFLRSYSQYLGVETAPLLARFPQDTPSPGAPSRPPSQEDRSGRGPSALFGSRVPEEPMIGVDIGVAIPTRRIGAGPTSFARTGIIAAVAIGVTALVVVLAIVIANTGGGNGENGLSSSPNPTSTSEATADTAASGLDVQRGVVPDVIGQPEDIARRAVEEAGFVVTVVTDRNEQYPRGTVFEQAPTAGVEQEPGRGVFIAVSEGP